jgi:biopolymer transport protein ExbD
MSAPHQSTEEPITQINVVPLVDIMLVLLIIFMLTANFIATPSLSVSAPKSYTAEPSAPSSQALVLTRERELLYKNRKVDEAGLRQALREDVALNPDLRVVLSADRAIPHGEVVALIDLARAAGVRKIALGVVK